MRRFYGQVIKSDLKWELLAKTPKLASPAQASTGAVNHALTTSLTLSYLHAGHKTEKQAQGRPETPSPTSQQGIEGA